ncbi:flagellar motor switch protein FliN [Lachnoclostridium pacaense]|uniref:flagellar motor switch protein FliN n=1 Tax=Enterocloster hominis (ex Hitch et al. 2024) TaxID=1917870 RepID=UPI001D10FDB2|nr:flagellar motor switch protein FliN [Lachnoclostridium pacaense]MCC2877072.1 flagellar motor switch protein FliN [Lachnoclostridium pacaense]
MAKAQEGQDIQAMTDGQMFEELIRIHAQAAGEAVSSILKADIAIGEPQIHEMTVKEVEYSLLEPAIFVKSCLTSQVAGNVVMILRQRDMQVFLNELMGVDDLPDPDFVFDDVAMSAAGELMNQMAHASASAMAQYLGDTMDFADCQLVLSDGRQNLSPVIGDQPDSRIMVVNYTMRIKDMVESEFIECISAAAIDSLAQEIQARQEAQARARQEEEEAARQAREMEKSVIVGQGAGRGQATPAAGRMMDGAAPAVPGLSWGGNAAAARTQPGQDTMYRSPAISGNLGLIMDVPLNVSVEIGKTRRRLKDVLNFNNGTVVELDKQADAPVDIIVNGQLIARGEVVVIDDNFGVRITEIVNTRSIIGNGE